MTNINFQVVKDMLLSNRAKSLYWRSGMMFLASLVGLLSASLELFVLSPWEVTFLGLVLGEISKKIDSVLKEKS